MKKTLLLLITALSAALFCAAENTVDHLLPDEFDVEANTKVKFDYVAPSGTEYIIEATKQVYDFIDYPALRIAYSKILKKKQGIVISKCLSPLRKVTVDFDRGLKDGVTLYVYGSDTPYESPSASYEEENTGTQIAQCTYVSGEDGAASSVSADIPDDIKFKYYVLRCSGASSAIIDVTAIHLEYDPAETALCAPVGVALPDGTAVTGRSHTLDEPMELTLSCATEGSVISYEFNGETGTLQANPGQLEIKRGGMLKLSASKEGFAPSERTVELSIPVKPVEVTAGGAVMVSDILRAYGKTAVALSTSTEGATLSWTYGDATGTSASLEVEADGVLTVTASKDGFVSATRTLDVRALDPLTSIQNVWNAYPLRGTGTELVDGQEFEVLFDATVVHAVNVEGNAEVYITDGTNFSRIFIKDASTDLEAGDVIAAGWQSKFRTKGGWKDFLPQQPLAAASHGADVPAPVAVADAAALETLDPGTPVVIGKATIETATPSEIFRGDSPSQSILPKDGSGNTILTMVNAFGLPSQEPGVYDIYGLVDFFGYKRNNAPAVGPTEGDYSHRRWRVVPTRYEVWKATTPRPRFGHADGDMLAIGAPIEISCQDAEATIMYSIDGDTPAVYDPQNKPVMPARDITVSAFARKENQHDSAQRSISLRFDPMSGITEIETDAAGEAVYYDLTGRVVSNPSAGIYLRRTPDGRTEKVVLR